MALTEPIQPQSALIRLDQQTGTLREREYELIITHGPDAGRSVPIRGTLVVGTHPDAGLSLTDPTVSRYHVELHARGDGVRVRDLESTNGTTLAGVRVREVFIEQEATLTVGKTTLRISIAETDLGKPDADRTSFGRVVGQGPAMRQLFGILERVAPTDSTVVLLGETGTGKELLAEAIHQNSKRRDRRMVVVDCGAIAPTLIESELFGHVKGSFTGAVADRLGAFLDADGGTLFLDEIGELPLDLQPKLLRSLESGMIKRVGEDRPRRVNVRVLAATHRDLEQEVEAGRLRRDLYFRLAVVLVKVPPLRERLEDLPLLARHFVSQLQRPEFELSEPLLERFKAYGWPGNVRELRNVVERALAGGDIEPLPAQGAAVTSPGRPPEGISSVPFKEAKEKLVDQFTREYLQELLNRCDGNISEAARVAGIARNYVHRLVAKYGLKAKD